MSNSYTNIWYHIPGYNGYQINKKGEVRSMKMMWSDPGHLLKRNKYGAYTLTNDQNKRVTVQPKVLLDATFNGVGEPIAVMEHDVYLGGRNKVFSSGNGNVKASEYNKLSLNIETSKSKNDSLNKDIGPLKLEGAKSNYKNVPIRFYD